VGSDSQSFVEYQALLAATYASTSTIPSTPENIAGTGKIKRQAMTPEATVASAMTAIISRSRRRIRLSQRRELPQQDRLHQHEHADGASESHEEVEVRPVRSHAELLHESGAVE
jgi:hypothetical protein